jgi:histidinol-phosphatase (PHP family)
MAAIERGIGIFAVTDHYDISSLDLSFDDWDAGLSKSLEDIRVAKARFQGRLRVLAGIELGQPLEKPSKAEEILASHVFDMVLASLHNAPGRLDIYFMPDHATKSMIDRELDAYFAALYELVRWGQFDCAAHITYPFRYVFGRRGGDYPYGHWDDHIEAVVKVIAEKGLALEVNTRGAADTPPLTLPDARWVRRFRELGGEKLTLGSDAHNPGAVGRGIAEGARIAAEAGFRRLCYFVGREPQYIAI